LLFVNITGNWKNRLAHTRQIIIADWLSLSESSWRVLSQGEFKPSSSDSADRGRSIIRVTIEIESSVAGTTTLDREWCMTCITSSWSAW
jgi:hypothetical protein